jgi:hypothetical protein
MACHGAPKNAEDHGKVIGKYGENMGKIWGKTPTK